MSNSPHDPALTPGSPEFVCKENAPWTKTVAKQIIEIEKLKLLLEDARGDARRLTQMLDDVVSEKRTVVELRRLMDESNGKTHTLRSMLRESGFPDRIKMGEDLHGNEDWVQVRVECQLKEALSQLTEARAQLAAIKAALNCDLYPNEDAETVARRLYHDYPAMERMLDDKTKELTALRAAADGMAEALASRPSRLAGRFPLGQGLPRRAPLPQEHEAGGFTILLPPSQTSPQT